MANSFRVNSENPFRNTCDKGLTIWQNENILAFIHEFGLFPASLATPTILQLVRDEWYFRFEELRDDPDAYGSTVLLLQRCHDHWRHWRAERNRAARLEKETGTSQFLDFGVQRSLFVDSDFGSENYVSSAEAHKDSV